MVTAGVILTLQPKKKKQMLIVSVLTNAMTAANILLLDEFNSGVMVCSVAVLQLLLSLRHEHKNTDAGIAEKTIFLVLYILGGIMEYETPIDLLSTCRGSFLYACGVSEKRAEYQNYASYQFISVDRLPLDTRFNTSDSHVTTIGDFQSTRFEI